MSATAAGPGTTRTAPSASLRETHCAWVMLTGDLAVKWKKPLDLGFVDWRKATAREHACRREVELNRRFAPDVYRDVLAVTDSAGRTCEWAGADEPDAGGPAAVDAGDRRSAGR